MLAAFACLALWPVGTLALRAGSSAAHAAQCDAKAFAALQARVAELEAENRRLRVAAGERDDGPAAPGAGAAAGPPAAPAVALAHTNASVRTAANSSWFPAADMPAPMPGANFVTDLNLLPSPASTGITSVAGSNEYGVPMARSTVKLENGKVLSYDDITYGYNKIWADLNLWTMQRYKGMRFFQAPTDAIAIQQLLWNNQPDLVIEIGTHGGGSAVFMSDIMKSYNPKAQIVTMDPDPTNIDPNGLFFKTENIKFIQGPSFDKSVQEQVLAATQGKKKVLVMHDGDHSDAGVSRDLAVFEKMVTVGSYFIVQDTTLDRVWHKQAAGGAMAAVRRFVSPGGQGYGRYGIDKAWEYLIFSTNHNGYLKKVRP